MAAIHKAGQSHFLQRRDRLESIVVPEWDEQRVYFRPAMSARERQAIWQHYDARAGKWDQYGAIITAILIRSLDADGRRLFADAARNELLDKYDPDVLERIAAEMGSFEPPADDDQKKSG